MESGIRILNPNALLHSYIPPRLPHREEEYEDLLKEYKIASYGLPPSHMIVLGPPGSGKTVTIRKALRDSEVPHVYLVSEPTAYGTLVALAGVLLGKRLWGLSFAPLWNSIERELPERCCLDTLFERSSLIDLTSSLTTPSFGLTGLKSKS
jgi:DNA polymerase III delta prime subunit